jgi:hypothetical protein
MDEENCPELLRRLFSHLPGGSRLLALLRLFWRRAASPASRSRGAKTSAKNFKNANASKNVSASRPSSPISTHNPDALADNASGSSSPKNSHALADKASGSSSPTSPKNREADPPSLAKNGDADHSSLALKNLDGPSSSTTSANNFDAGQSSLAANTCRSPVRTSRTSHGSSKPTLFIVHCRLCGWTDREPFPVLVEHVYGCTGQRYIMETRMQDKKEEKKKKKLAAARRTRRRW